jgi:hypothetical protein
MSERREIGESRDATATLSNVARAVHSTLDVCTVQSACVLLICGREARKQNNKRSKRHGASAPRAVAGVGGDGGRGVHKTREAKLGPIHISQSPKNTRLWNVDSWVVG